MQDSVSSILIQTPEKSSLVNRLARTTGWFFIILGLLANEWILCFLFSPDRHLIPTTRIVIAIFDLSCLILGLITLRQRSFRFLGRLFLLFAIPALLLFLLEWTLEFLHTEEYRSNAAGSFRLIANLKTAGHETNSFGMHWREVARENPYGKQRIAFLGDSFTFGCCAHGIRNSFAGIFDSRLSSNTVEVLNFGVPGYGIADMYLQLKEDVVPFHPDYALLMFFDGNDFQDTYFSVDGKRIRGHERFHTYRKLLPAAYLGTPYDRLLTRIRELQMYRLFIIAEERLENHVSPDKRYPQDYNFAPGNIFTSPQFFCHLPYPPVAERAKDLSLQYLDHINDICRRNRTRLMIMSLPFKAQVYSRSMTGPDYNLEYPQKYVELFSNQHSIPYADALPVFREYVSLHQSQLFAADGHYNDEGHRLFAEILIRFFLKNASLKNS